MTNCLPSSLTAVIFDWDNTLVDSWGAITQALNKVRVQYGLDTWSVEEARIKSSRALRVSFPEWFGDKWEEARDIFYDHINKVHLEQLHVMNGAPELLDWFEVHEIPMFIVSTKKNILLRAEVTHLGWDRYFKGIIGSLDAPHDKPDQIPVEMALKQGGMKADNPSVWFVGDAQTDVECALRSGCMPVLIGFKNTAEKFGIKAHFSDCQGLVTALNKGDIFSSH